MVEHHNHLICSHLLADAGTRDCHSDGDTLVMVFEDGCLEINKVVLCAVSGLRHILQDCDKILLESSMSSGQHFLDLLTTGVTPRTDQPSVNQVETLLQMLDVKIDVLVENYSLELPDLTELSSINIVLPPVDNFIVADETEDDNVNNAQPPEVTNIKLRKENRRIFKCDIHPCSEGDAEFAGLAVFRKHTTQVHKMKPLPCPQSSSGCKFRADDVTKLNNHIFGVHKNIYSDNICCDICHKTFPSTNYLRSHVKRMHNTEQSQRKKICPFCGESKLQLNDHIMRVHKVRKYFCDLCPKSFKTNVQRRIHRNVHTGFKPYTCATCDQTFSRLHHRKVHLEKYSHCPGPVLKPPDHVDHRSVKNKPLISDLHTKEVVTEDDDGNGEDVIEFVHETAEDYLDQVGNMTSEQLKQEIGVNCAEIIQNITLSNEDLGFE